MNQPRTIRRGFTLLELLAIVVILAVITAAVMPRISISGVAAKERLQAQQITDLNKALERYRFEHSAAANDLSELVTAGYYPEGVPASPVTGAPYTIDATTGRIAQ